MTRATTHTLATVRVLTAEARCPCGRWLVLVQLPGSHLTDAEAVCGRCVGAVRK